MNVVKKLCESIREYKKNAILTPIYVSLEVVVDTTIPYVMKYLLECFPSDGSPIDVGLVLLYGLILVALAVVALLFGALAGEQCAIASAGFMNNLRSDMFERIQSFSFKNVDKFSNASLITRMTTDAGFVYSAFMQIIRTAVRAPLVLIFAVVMSIIIGGPLSVIYVVIIPVLAGALLGIFMMADKYFKSVFKKYDQLNNVVEENIRGMRVVKSNVSEDVEIQKFKSTSDDIYKTFVKAESRVVLSGPVMQLLVYVSIMLIFYFGSKTIIGSNGTGLSTSDLSVLVTYAVQVLMSLMMLSFVFIQTVIAKEPAQRIYEVLTEEPDIVNKEVTVNEVKDGSIDFTNVSFKYSLDAELASLSGIDLHIKSGEVIGILGSTGSSKTTLVQLIPRLYDVTEGSLKVGGVEVSDYDIKTLRGAVSMVLQKNVLFSGTVRQNLLWGKPDATDEEMMRALEISESKEFILKMGGLDANIEQEGSNLSGGQRQRLCIARAIIGQPKILIMDDSTSAVDVKTDSNIRAAFGKFMPDTTKIIIAQRISSVINADRIVVMEGGKIDAVGTHDELLATNEIYKEIYFSQESQGGDFDARTE